jgi:uncharacterized protein (DUF697 family)
MTTYSASYPVPQRMIATIENCTVGLGAVGVFGGLFGPGTDLVIIAPTWIGMTIALADQAGVSMDEATAKKLVYATVTGVGSFAAGAKIAATVAGWLLAIPSAGLSLGLSMAGNAALNAKFTHAYGLAIARYFLQTDGLEDGDLTIKVLIALVAVQFGFRPDDPSVFA